jgi:NAD(P)-dependent dehydrogenase (short-subunit alcohol dehydrogenase family)
VNNAGIPAAGPLELIPIDEIRQVLEVNLIGAVAVTQAFLPLLKAARGRIVNISSVAGRAALPFMGPYAASKFALEAISDSWRRELIPFGVQVIVIEPGSFRSRIWNKIEAMDLSRYRGTPYEQVMERVRRGALRSGEEAPPPDRVARVVAHALTARRPPIRRVVSPHTWYSRLLLRLPDRVLDWLIERRWRRRE